MASQEYMDGVDRWWTADYRGVSPDPFEGAPQWVLEHLREYRAGKCMVVDCHEQRSNNDTCAGHENAMSRERFESRADHEAETRDTHAKPRKIRVHH